jgi:hypothetical protein
MRLSSGRLRSDSSSSERSVVTPVAASAIGMTSRANDALESPTIEPVIAVVTIVAVLHPSISPVVIAARVKAPAMRPIVT